MELRDNLDIIVIATRSDSWSIRAKNLRHKERLQHAEGVDMPKFFFNLTNGETVRDERGTDCTSVEQAKEFAVVVAAELGRNRLPKDIQQLAVFVTNETGSEVFRTKLVNQQERTSADEIVQTARRGSDNEPSH